jgi:hypothetical protein
MPGRERDSANDSPGQRAMTCHALVTHQALHLPARTTLRWDLHADQPADVGLAGDPLQRVVSITNDDG